MEFQINSLLRILAAALHASLQRPTRGGRGEGSGEKGHRLTTVSALFLIKQIAAKTVFIWHRKLQHSLDVTNYDEDIWVVWYMI